MSIINDGMMRIATRRVRVIDEQINKLKDERKTIIESIDSMLEVTSPTFKRFVERRAAAERLSEDENTPRIAAELRHKERCTADHNITAARSLIMEGIE